MKKQSSTPRFEVNYKTRLEQQRTATDAVRLPKLGYKQYRIYDEVPKKNKSSVNGMYGQHIGRGIRNTQIQHWTTKLQIFIDEMTPKVEPKFVVKWLKPKQATVLRLQGHRVEEVV